MKLKEFGPRGGRCPNFYYVDPSLFHMMHAMVPPPCEQTDTCEKISEFTIYYGEIRLVYKMNQNFTSVNYFQLFAQVADRGGGARGPWSPPPRAL